MGIFGRGALNFETTRWRIDLIDDDDDDDGGKRRGEGVTRVT